MRKTILVAILIFFILSLTSCHGFAFIRKDGPYEGKVIDAETGLPIEGVVVLGVWYREHPGPGGAVSEYYDAMETITDKGGDFKIKGLGLLVMSNVLPMDVLIFKAGYTHYGLMTWKALKELDETKGNEVIIPLKKLTMEDRKKLSGPPSPPHKAALKKVILMLREIDKNDRERGLPTRGVWKGEKYE